MITAINPSPASADAGTPLQQLLKGAPQAESISVDFKKGTWAFKPAAWYQAGAGTYLIVPLAIANMALASEAATHANNITLAEPKVDRVSYRPLNGQPAIEVFFDNGESDDYYRYMQPPDGAARRWNPAHWVCHKSRKDQHGHSWSSYNSKYVTDDFGDLVEVTA